MSSTDPRELAASMIRLYGKVKAHSLADRYASACTANNDAAGHSKWASVAASIGEIIEQERRFGSWNTVPR